MKKKYIVFWVGLIVLSAGCKKFLKEQDPTDLTPDSYFTQPEHAEAALAAVYADTRFIGRAAAIFSFNWQLLDAPVGISRTESGENTNLTNLYTLSYDGSNLHVTNWWTGLYHVIANANLVLAKVPGITPMDEAERKKVLGQAHFLRAWAYFYAVRMWGDIPLITQPQTASSPDFLPSRTAQDQVYDLIVQDLTTADSSGLPWTDASGHASLAAVKAELAKVYLTMAGQPLNKGLAYYKLAADKALEVITYANANPGQIGLFAGYGDLHDVNKENVLEQLFEIQYQDGIEPNSGLINLLPNFKPVTVYGQYGTGTTVPTQDFVDSYESGDLRAVDRQGFFYTNYYENGSGPLFSLGAPYLFKYFDVTSYGAQNVPGIAKENLNMMNIRYADVLLVYAEAQNEADGAPNAAAYSAFKAIRDRAQLTTDPIGSFNQQTFREAVWRERWHELCYENILWFDMVRLRKVYNEITNGFDDFVGHVNRSSSQALQQKHLLFPLPQSEINSNPNLKQNTGY
jgi:hypothetical protein